jgi:hypothetical protein
MHLQTACGQEGVTDPRLLEANDRVIEGLRKAGMPEGEAKKN